jgi:glutathione reductase (NADPH)
MDEPHIDFDLIVIGAGMAGVNAANKSVAAGWRTGIVDLLQYGGTYALRDCDPKEILRQAAGMIDAARLMAGKGIEPCTLTVDWAELMRHKRGFTDPVPDELEGSLERSLEVDERTITARRFLIATGARRRP